MHDFVRAAAAAVFSVSPGALALLLTAPVAVPASAQPAAPPPAPASAPPAASAAAPSERLAPVLVTGKAPPEASVAGFQPQPLARTPVQAAVVDAAALRDAGARTLADLVRFDAGTSDAYTTEGYIDSFTVRGFVLDNRFNFRRDGLPASGETSIPLANKASVEILKGLSGIQTGTSSPGGLVNTVVKRPLDTALSTGFVEWRERGSVLGAVDLSRRVPIGGGDASAGLRLNAAVARLDPRFRDAEGHQRLLALAGDVRLGRETTLEAEIEHGRRSQPSVPAFSLLGDRVPAPVDPRTNLNNQPWSLPNVFDTTTASLRLKQSIGRDWTLVVHGLQQGLRTDDRTAFPFGCGAENAFDRYCSDGTYDLYDFRSENERRRTRALDVHVQGRFATGAAAHTVSVGALRSLYRLRTQPQVFNFAGTGNVEGTLAVPEATSPLAPSTNRDERSTELYARDAIELGPWSAWLGIRHTRLARATVLTDGSSPTAYGQSFASPFAALAYAWRPGQLVYASWGRGSESDVAPNRPVYANAGQALPAARSRQWEVGVKGGGDRTEFAAAAFDLERPLYGDLGACDPALPGSCTRALDGTQRHRGVEASLGAGTGPWDVAASLQWLRARVDGRANAALNGREPTNVPPFSARLLGTYAVGALPGLALQGGLVHEGRRQVLPDNSLQIGSWTRVDLGARYAVRVGGIGWTARFGLDNAFDRRAWRESPYQFAHAYLYPLAPRTARLSLQADL